MTKIELLAPAGSISKFNTALHFGADAVYLSGKEFGLRAFSDNFELSQIKQAVDAAHEIGKKVYVTVNIYAKERDFERLPEYLVFLESINVDAVIVSDPGIIHLIKSVAPKLEIHLSTQANTTNSYAVKFWAQQGVKRIVLARECTLDEIRAICLQAEKVGVEIETFVHGAMCISYSGRCLLSDYFTSRGGNRGECVQACRWEWIINEPGKTEDKLVVSEDKRGTYFLNSKDLNMLSYLDAVIDAGVKSIKIEGRMKSEYYLATVVNAYRRALDAYYGEGNNAYAKMCPALEAELLKAGHRQYTTGFYFPDSPCKQFYEHSKAVQESEFTAIVLDWENGIATVEMRNRFAVGDTLEIISTESLGQSFTVETINDLIGNSIVDAKLVQQTLLINCRHRLNKGDILRKPKSD